MESSGSDGRKAQETVLQLFYGRWRSQTMYAGVKLGIFDSMGDEPREANAIARELGLDAGAAYRLMRALAALGLLQLDITGQCSITDAGALLRSDHALSLRDAVLLREGPEHTAVWRHLPQIVQDGRQDGFVREFGDSAFEYAARTPSYAAAFDAGMSSQSALQTQWTLEVLQHCDLQSVAHLCDIGGGQGRLLCSVLAAYPGMRGTILERASIGTGRPPWAERLGVADRCVRIAGDMFAEVPAADAYILKMILHDWNDDECIRILANARRSVSQAGRIFIVEHVVPDSGEPDFAALFDMHMLCWGTGCERTAREYASLLGASGWRYVATRAPATHATGVIEGAAS